MTIPPRRLSVDKDSPYFDFRYSHDPKLAVYLNGAEQKSCVVEYCQAEGWIDRFKRENDCFVIIDHEIVIERVHGVVSVCFKD